MTFGTKDYVFVSVLLLAAVAFVLVKFLSADNPLKASSGFIGKSEISIEDGRMTPEAMLSLGRLSDPQVSPDGTRLMYGVSYSSIEDNRSVRNLYISDIDGSNAVLATKAGKSISNARWSNDGRKVAFLMEGQIWIADVKGYRLVKARRVSDIENGIGEFKLSPDQCNVVFTSSVPGRVRTPAELYPDLGKAEAYETGTLMYRHWDHWTTEITHSFIAAFDWNGKVGAHFDILGSEGADRDGGISPYELPTEPFNGLEDIDWSPDSRHLAYACKKVKPDEYTYSTDTEIYLYCLASGETAVIPMGGGYDTHPVWSPDGSRICWISMARNGYEADKQRLMVADIDTGTLSASGIRDLSAGFRYNAADPIWGRDGKHILFNALVEGLQGIFSADLNGNIDRRTPDTLWYDFSTPYYVAKDGDGEKLYASWQSMDFPTELVCIGADGECTPVTRENGHILNQLKPHRTEARKIKTVDGKEMLTWVLYPPEFDPDKTYPAIEICLGGPQGTLSQGWSYRWNYRLMCSQGYVVVLPNRRGTTAFGQEWCEQISGDYCGLNIQDYLAAAKELKVEPYIGKMAACGASYGGYSVYYLCGVHGDVFDAFIAHAGIFNQEHMYMTTEEMWFPNWDNGGAPWDANPVAVRHYAHSPHKLIKNWHTPLLVIHGGSDFRVPYDQGMAAYNCAKMMGVPAQLIVFPNENHWILKPQNALFWHRSYFSWLDRWLTER